MKSKMFANFCIDELLLVHKWYFLQLFFNYKMTTLVHNPYYFWTLKREVSVVLPISVMEFHMQTTITFKNLNWMHQFFNPFFISGLDCISLIKMMEIHRRGGENKVSLYSFLFTQSQTNYEIKTGQRTYRMVTFHKETSLLNWDHP